MKFLVVIFLIFLSNFASLEAKEKKCTFSENDKLPKLNELEQELDGDTNKMIQKNYMNTNFRGVCVSLFTDFDQKYARIKHCYENNPSLKKAFDVSLDSSKKLRVICEFDKDVRKFIGHDDEDIKIEDVKECIDSVSDLCRATDDPAFWNCITRKVTSAVSSKNRSIAEKYIKTIMKFSKDNSYCGADHLLLLHLA